MNKSYESDDCAAVIAHSAAYSILEAAVLWCDVHEDELEEILEDVEQICETGTGRGIWFHPDVPCLEPRSRAIAVAMEKGELPYGREDGISVEADDYVAYERRHVLGQDLKKWMEKEFPSQKPPFLFDEIERSTHPAISADAYRSIIAQKDKLSLQLQEIKAELKKAIDEKHTLELERDSLRAMVDKQGAPSERAESTYQNAIAALLDYIKGKVPGIEKHPSFSSEAKLIETLADFFRGYGGLSMRNLQRMFAEAKRGLKSP